MVRMTLWNYTSLTDSALTRTLRPMALSSQATGGRAGGLDRILSRDDHGSFALVMDLM
jgi:hypothetical protein